MERERRPNGNTTCENGHTYSSAAFDRHELAYESSQEDRDYRSRIDPAIEGLGLALVEIGVSNEPLNDDMLVELAARKLRQMYRMLKAAGVAEEMLAAVMAD